MARAKHKDSLREFAEGIVRCPICFCDIMEQPKQLACGHSFCLKCVIRHFKRQPNKRNGVECAICRSKTAVPPQGLKKLPSFFLAEQAKESLAKADRIDATNDSMCNTHRRNFEAWCTQCSELLCCYCNNGHTGHDTCKLNTASAEIDALYKNYLQENLMYKNKIVEIKNYQQTIRQQKDNALGRATEEFNKRLLYIKKEAADIEKRHLAELNKTLEELETTYITRKKITDDFQQIHRDNMQQKLPYLQHLLPGGTQDLEEAKALPLPNQPDPFEKLFQTSFDDLFRAYGDARGRPSGDIRSEKSSMPADTRSRSRSVIQLCTWAGIMILTILMHA